MRGLGIHGPNYRLEIMRGGKREYINLETPDIIADSVHAPSWRGNIMVDHEKAACRAARRRC